MPVADSLNEFESTPFLYGTFKDRALALLIDGIILLPLIVIDWFNKSDWKSQILLTIVFLVGTIYKPLLEFKYGATIGKKSMKLIVVNTDYQKVNLKEVLIRNIFDITSRIFFFGARLMTYRSNGFVNVTSNREFITFQKTIVNLNPYLLFFSLITLIEIIFILCDKQKRALHDRMGATFVIKNKSQ